MNMGSSNHTIVDVKFLFQPFPYFNYMIVKNAYGIERNQGNPRCTIVNDHCPGPYAVVHAIGSPSVLEPGKPISIEPAISIDVVESITFLRLVPGIPIHIVPCIHNFGGY